MNQPTIQRGSFTLARHFHRTEWLRGGGLALLMLALGAFGFGYGTYVMRDLLEVSRIWREGHDSPVEAAYGGRVTTHNFVLKNYVLDVTYLSEESEEPITFKAEFYRFFTGPDEGDSMTVRYMPQAPEQAVTSWQEQGLAHGWVWASFMWVLGGIGLFGAVATVRSTAKTTRLVDSLVRDGKLLVAQVQQAEASGTAQAPALTVHFKTGPSEVIKQAFVLKRGGPLFANGEQLVVLASSDEKEAYALREDGYPLAELPDLTLLGITPTQPAEPDNQVEADSEEDEEEEEDEDDLAKAG